MAAPPTINLLGEIIIIPAAWFSFYAFGVVLTVMVFLRAAYNMYLYTRVNHGDSSFYLRRGTTISHYEAVSVASHILPLLLIFKSRIFIIN